MNDHAVRSKPERGQTGARSRRLILDTAAELFSTQGYAATGLRQIADRVGIRTASLYYHFVSKERMLEEIMRIAVEDTARHTRDAVGGLPADATPKDRIEAAVRGHLHGLHGNPHYTSVNIKGQVPRDVYRLTRPQRDGYSDYWRALLEDAQRTGWLKPELQISLLRPLILGTLNRTLTWFDPTLGPVDDLVVTTTQLFAGLWRPEKLSNG